MYLQHPKDEASKLRARVRELEAENAKLRDDLAKRDLLDMAVVMTQPGRDYAARLEKMMEGMERGPPQTFEFNIDKS